MGLQFLYTPFILFHGTYLSFLQVQQPQSYAIITSSLKTLISE